MEQQLFKTGLIHFGIFLLLSIIALIITLWFIKRFIAKKHNIENYNTAFGIFTGGIVFSVFYIISVLVTPVISTLKLLGSSLNSWQYTIESAKHISILLIIALVLALVICTIVIAITKRYLKGINIYEEIKNNNLGISILVVTVLISCSFLLKDNLQMILDSFVPYPEMPNLLY
ncbi:hypothetical protein BTO05_00460 [Winogradskyella sp. PC-19]|uniref:DUF350 domain-containing protein n=1 Tax=Winogradskyella sp. PC-19 TaxID=754417 RepID=UPI000B3CBB0B|nr:hypothetical protein [Winogradskyella sp. PC-19]ARV08185.1 hypothetical protein BTO05_00460 [Winogradskyella sp. PC-19]